MRSISGPFDKRMKAAYQDLHGVAPQKYPYTEADRPLMEQVWATHYEPGNSTAALV